MKKAVMLEELVFIGLDTLITLMKMTMRKYEVIVSGSKLTSIYTTLKIEADSAEEAEDIALELMNSGDMPYEESVGKGAEEWDTSTAMEEL